MVESTLYSLKITWRCKNLSHLLLESILFTNLRPWAPSPIPTHSFIKLLSPLTRDKLSQFKRCGKFWRLSWRFVRGRLQISGPQHIGSRLQAGIPLPSLSMLYAFKCCFVTPKKGIVVFLSSQLSITNRDHSGSRGWRFCSFYLNFFTIPKLNGDVHAILDLKRFNRFAQVQTFRMESMWSVVAFL